MVFNTVLDFSFIRYRDLKILLILKQSVNQFLPFVSISIVIRRKRSNWVAVGSSTRPWKTTSESDLDDAKNNDEE
ncbi:hypothetical protein L596_017089 [Steinernema carpocapsae]|uniref:Uncharacterized protein n=1 Tax=Steinernema carpocapsae TaxID=34508 RepID=A0A4U5N0Y7_STECR|nr:hypothetical protein L596_017089 [Steinernema carpocapsae]